jgi:hypothetical protein
VLPTNPSAILQLAQLSPNWWLPKSNSPINCSRHQAQAPAHGRALICSGANAARPNSPPRPDPNDPTRRWEERWTRWVWSYHEWWHRDACLRRVTTQVPARSPRPSTLSLNAGAATLAAPGPYWWPETTPAPVWWPGRGPRRAYRKAKWRPMVLSCLPGFITAREAIIYIPRSMHSGAADRWSGCNNHDRILKWIRQEMRAATRPCSSRGRRMRW